VSPVRYGLGFYIPEDGILHGSVCFALVREEHLSESTDQATN
jgi:hypothetical protein